MTALESVPTRTCVFSPCRKYRYTLWREWPVEDLLLAEEAKDNAHRYLMVIGLNPSTADETKDDPTIRKCIGFAKRWGFGALCMTNLFAWRDTKPENMKKSEFPVGAENLDHLLRCACEAGFILAAWGKHGAFIQQDQQVMAILRHAGLTVHCLRRNADGTPMHPLYVPYETPTLLFP